VALPVLAVSPSPTEAPIDPARVTPGILGLLSLLFLAVAVFLLWRSMTKQIRKIQFEGSVPVDPEAADETPAEPAAEAARPDAEPTTDPGPGAPEAGDAEEPEPRTGAEA
jgi:hypothetical protein